MRLQAEVLNGGTLRAAKPTLEDFLLFNPYAATAQEIARAKKRLRRLLASMTTSGIFLTEDMAVPLERLIGRSQLAGFTAAARITGRKVPKNYPKIAEDAAWESAKSIRKTSRKLKKAGRLDEAMSPERADKIADYEGGRAYFKGMKDGFAGWEMVLGKEWVTAEDPCENCLDAEDEGIIPFDETFGNGEDSPPLHLNCRCHLAVHPFWSGE